MPFPVCLLFLILSLLLRLPISTLQQTRNLDSVLHPSHIAGLGLDSHLFSKCFLEDEWGLSFLQWAWMVKDPLMLVYKHSQSTTRLPLIKKLHWLPCSTIFSNWRWFYITVTDHRRSLDKPRTLALHLGYGQNGYLALLVLKIPKQPHWLRWSLLFPLV